MFNFTYCINRGEGGNTETEIYIPEGETDKKMTEIVNTMLSAGRYPDAEDEEFADIMPAIREEIKGECASGLCMGDDPEFAEYMADEDGDIEDYFRIDIESPFYLLEDEAETLFRAMFDRDADDSEFEDVINLNEENPDMDEDELWKIAFITAIEKDNVDFVRLHTEDVDLMNDDEYGASYIAMAESDEMVEALEDGGFIPSDEEMYDNGESRFCVSSNEGEIIRFDDDLQQEAFEKYKKKYGFTDEDIVNIVKYEMEVETDEKNTGDFQIDLSLLGVGADDDDEIEFWSKNCENEGFELKDLLESLGYETDFIGTRNSFESTGYWTIE